MIANKKEKKRADTGTYHRTKAQKKPEDFTAKGDSERGYDKSSIESGAIKYPTAGDKI